jgi:hypothetical protein
LKESLQGNFPVSPQAGFDTYVVAAKMLTFLTYLDRASDEFERAMAANSDAMIEDAAGIMAQYHTDEQIRDLEQLASLDATRKAFQTLYTASRLMTGFSLEDSRAFAALNAWARQLSLGATPFAMPSPNSPSGVPSVARMAKAQTLITDALRISRIEEMTMKVISFLRDVYIPSAGMTPDEKKSALDKIQEFELSYSIKKGIGFALAPVLLASYLDDGQIDVLSEFVKTPAFTKFFSLNFDVVQSGTSFTPDDIKDASSLLRRINPSGNNETDMAWRKYYDRWSKIVYESIAPEIRAGLEKSWLDLRKSGTSL